MSQPKVGDQVLIQASVVWRGLDYRGYVGTITDINPKRSYPVGVEVLVDSVGGVGGHPERIACRFPELTILTTDNEVAQ